ncbi:MAG: hypothetical protein OEZ36_03775 [Spirochaetota bacterium]|nr:hypothetical protein [Spirochaetota bacterium]
MKKLSVILIILLLTPLGLSSQSKKRKSLNQGKPKTFHKYFREKKIVSHNNFRYIETIFVNEILGYPDEKIQTLKAIQKNNGSFYKVYYYKTNVIMKYQYFEKGYLKTTALYKYGRRNSRFAGKLIEIRYLNEKKEEVALEVISYNRFGKASKTTRYRLPGKKLNNLF